MAKPILLIKYPYTFRLGVTELDNAHKSLCNQVGGEYHVLLVSHKKDDVEFQVFYEKDFTEVNYEELKEIIQKHQSESTKIDNF